MLINKSTSPVSLWFLTVEMSVISQTSPNYCDLSDRLEENSRVFCSLIKVPLRQKTLSWSSCLFSISLSSCLARASDKICLFISVQYSNICWWIHACDIIIEKSTSPHASREHPLQFHCLSQLPKRLYKPLACCRYVDPTSRLCWLRRCRRDATDWTINPTAAIKKTSDHRLSDLSAVWLYRHSTEVKYKKGW